MIWVREKPSVSVRLIDGSTVELLVCRVPDGMLRQIIAVGDSWESIMELTCLIKADFAGDQMNEVTPPIPVPDGYSRMQKNWPDNLTDESARQVWSIIERLNMSRAAALADRLLQRAIEEGRLQEDSMLTPAQVAAL